MAVRHLALTVSVLALFGCQSKRFESAAPGQPSMHDLAQRRTAPHMESDKRMAAIRERAKTLTDEQASALLAQWKKNPNNQDLASTLLQHFELTGDTASLNSLNLWYIEHRPAGPMWTRLINSRVDPNAYQRGRALWLANVKRPAAEPVVFLRAAAFLKDADRLLAESVLRSGMRAYPKSSDWNRELGMLYSQESERGDLAESNDAPLLVATARGSIWRANSRGAGSLILAHEYVSRAERLDPDFTAKSGIAAQLKNAETSQRIQSLVKLTPAEKAKLPESDQLLLTVLAMQIAWNAQKENEAEVQAHKALALAARLPSDPMHDVVAFEGNITLGKVAFRRGKRTEAAHYMRLAADAPADGLRWTLPASVSLVSALIDAGYRSEAADFLDRVAGKTERQEQYREWAAQIRKGINPTSMPSFSSMGCQHDPC